MLPINLGLLLCAPAVAEREFLFLSYAMHHGLRHSTVMLADVERFVCLHLSERGLVFPPHSHFLLLCVLFPLPRSLSLLPRAGASLPICDATLSVAMGPNDAPLLPRCIPARAARTEPQGVAGLTGCGSMTSIPSRVIQYYNAPNYVNVKVQ